MTRIALDDALGVDRSLRTVDADGHMKVAESRISKANVCPYRGNEIPNFDQLHLDPARIYYLYRDPAELAKAASTFDGKPLLIKHVPITADLPSQSLWVGTLGPCTFEAPYLITRPLMVLTKQAIDLIESLAQRELSAGYRYRAVMEPGTSPDGQRYDGRMVDIAGNHVAIVSEGRAGRDVHVADSLPLELKPMNEEQMKALLTSFGATLKAELKTEIQSEVKVAMDAATTVMKESIGQVAPMSTITLDASEKAEAMKEALEAKKKKHGKDAKLTDEEEADCYDKAMKAKDKKMGKDKLPNPKDHKEDFDPNKGGAKDGAISFTKAELAEYIATQVSDGVKLATDSAVKLAVDATEKRATAQAEARAKVRPLVGEVSLAMDSAEIYRFALKAKGLDASAIHESALPALVDVYLSKATAAATEVKHALDATQEALLDISAMFGSAAAH